MMHTITDQVKKYIFPSTSRLRTRSDFDRVFQIKKKLHSVFFVVYLRPNHLSCSRLGVIASKRNMRFAVQRNHVRRIVREQFRLKQFEFVPTDFVFVVKKEASLNKNNELAVCCKNLFLTCCAKLQKTPVSF